MNVSKFPAASSRGLSAAPLGFVDQAREILISLMDHPLPILRFRRWISETLIFAYSVIK